MGTTMSTRRMAIIAAVSALAGLVVGACGASWYLIGFNAQFMESNLALRTGSDIVSKVSVLEHLRAGRTEHAASLLEALLDGDLMTAGALAGVGHKFSPNAQRAAAVELIARQASGYQPIDPNVRAAVENALRLLASPQMK